MIRRCIALLAMAIMLAGTASLAMAGDKEGKKGKSYENVYISPEKQQKVDSIMREFDSATEQQRQDLYSKHLQLKAVSGSGNIDYKWLAGLTDEIAKLEMDLVKKYWVAVDRIRSELGPECADYACKRGRYQYGGYMPSMITPDLLDGQPVFARPGEKKK